MNKNYIRPSFFIRYIYINCKKLNNGLYIYIDYRAFNTVIIRNRNIFLLIRNILSRFLATKFFTKFNIIFNEIRIKKGDKYKTAFLIY